MVNGRNVSRSLLIYWGGFPRVGGVRAGRMWACRVRARLDRELLDARALCGHLVGVGSVHAFLAEHRSRLFPDGLFADLFGSRRGRPSVPGEVVATVMVAPGARRLVGSAGVPAAGDRYRVEGCCGSGVD